MARSRGICERQRERIEETKGNGTLQFLRQRPADRGLSIRSKDFSMQPLRTFRTRDNAAPQI